MALTPGFTDLRDRIVELAEPRDGDAAVDIGAGTGLLTLALAQRVRRVWAVDSSQAMTECLREKASNGDLANVEVVHASAVRLPLGDSVADLVVSNYCFHELRHADKKLALAEAMRVMRPGGRLVIGDMMFSLNPVASRDRRLVIGKVLAIARRGLPGAWRLLKNVARLVTGRWEHPAGVAWWKDTLRAAGFERVRLETCAHEGGIVVAYAPATKTAQDRGRGRRPAHGEERSEATRGTLPAALIGACASAFRFM